MNSSNKLPIIQIDINEVKSHLNNPEALVEKIKQQAGALVFDISTAKGRDSCRSHSADIIKCITPAIAASKSLAIDAKKVIADDLNFRKVFENGVREIADNTRKPLTEWEAEQKRIAEEKAAMEAEIAERKRIAMQFLIDWDAALVENELFDLRKEKAERDAKELAERKERERLEYEQRLQEQAIERERERIRIEEEAKAKREIEQKMREEQAEKDRLIAEQVERDRLERENQEMLDYAKAEAERRAFESEKVEEPVRNAAGRTFEESKVMFGEVTLADVDMAMDKHFKDARSAKDSLDLSKDQLLVFINTLIECGLKNTPCYFNTIQQLNMQSESGIEGYLIKAALCSSISEIADMLNNMPVEVKPTMKPILAEKQKIIKAQQAAA